MGRLTPCGLACDIFEAKKRAFQRKQYETAVRTSDNGHFSRLLFPFFFVFQRPPFFRIGLAEVQKVQDTLLGVGVGTRNVRIMR